MDITEREKIPPQSLEAEQSLLGAVLLDPEAMVKIADMVDPSDFYKDTHKRIFETMTELYSRNQPIDLLTLGNRLEEKGQSEQTGGRSYLAGLANTVPTAAHIVQYATIIRRKATMRKLLIASH